jgi:hypothetical protein
MAASPDFGPGQGVLGRSGDAGLMVAAARRASRDVSGVTVALAGVVDRADGRRPPCPAR